MTQTHHAKADPMPLTVPLVSGGGVLGALTRYGLGAALPFTSLEITWAINVSGCLLMGLLMATIDEHSHPRRRYLRPFLGVGFLGGYTTFSTFVVDLQTVRPMTSLAYLGLTVAGCLVAVWLGARLAGGHR